MANLELIEAMEENLTAHVSFVQRHLPGMTVDDRPDLLLVDSGLFTDTFNKILRARMDENEADHRIAQAVDYFHRAGRPFAWWVGPRSRPDNLGQRLETHGLKPVEFELGMAAELRDVPAAVPPPEGLSIRRVRTTAELLDFAAVNAANWDPPDQAVVEFFGQAAPLLLVEDCPMRLFVGYMDGQAVAASELFLGGGVAGIHMVSTRRAYRRRGIGLAMTWAAVDEGRRVGETTVTLQASEQGRGVYARLGFQACCEFTEYQ